MYVVHKAEFVSKQVVIVDNVPNISKVNAFEKTGGWVIWYKQVELTEEKLNGELENEELTIVCFIIHTSVIRYFSKCFCVNDLLYDILTKTLFEHCSICKFWTTFFHALN